MSSSHKSVLNIAYMQRETEVLGPGKRYAVWVQGCCFHCPECLSPEWAPRKTAQLVPLDQLALEIIETPELEGLTFSGGEPFLQAGEIAMLIQAVRHFRPEMSTICFTGFTLEQLKEGKNPEQLKLLDSLDVLIDGPYIKELNDDQGLRGSSNQNIHFLTDRYLHLQHEFLKGKRDMEIHLLDEGALTVGIPPQNYRHYIKKHVFQ